MLVLLWAAMPVSANMLPDSMTGKFKKTLEDLGIDDVVIDLNVRIPMTVRENPVGYDCHLWATTMHHTDKVAGTASIKRPTILLVTAYRREIMGMMRCLSMLTHDYNIMWVDMRGTGSGEGFWDALNPVEAYDAAYIIDRWIPAQPWSDGRVGMVGGSYEGILQYLAAGLVEQEYDPEKGGMMPKHLKAISPLSPYNDVYRDIVMHGGNFEMEFMAVWIMITDFMSIIPPDIMLGGFSEDGFNGEDFQMGVEIWKEHASQLGVPIGWIVDPDHELKDDWYQMKNPMLYWPQKPEAGWDFGGALPPEVGEKVIAEKLPVFTSTGWFDIFTRGALNNYEYGLANHSASDKAMIIGPWYHFGAAFTLPGVTGIGGQGTEHIFSHEILARWFDWKIKGVNDPFMEEFPVVMYVMGEDKWRAEKAWPLPESRRESRRYYLSKAKAPVSGDWFSVCNAADNYKMVANPESSDYNLTVFRRSIPRPNPVLDHDPTHLHGKTSRSSKRWLGFSPQACWYNAQEHSKGETGIQDDLPWEDERSDEVGVLTFTTDPLDDDMEITGPLKLTFWAKTRYTEPLRQKGVDKVVDRLSEFLGVEVDENNILKFIDKTDVQWVVEINDVFPEGRARNITSGWLAAAHRPYDPTYPTRTDPAYTAFDPFYDHPDKVPNPIEENTLYQYVVEIWPTDNVFKKGHRIRLSLSASDFPHLFPVFRPSKNTIVIDEAHKARLDFDVVNKKGQGVTWKWIDDIDDHLLYGRH